MCKVPASYGTRRVVRFAFAGMTAALLAGCAESSKFLGDPLGNPFKTASTDTTPTASYDREMAPPPPYRPRSSSAISSQPLAPPATVTTRRVASYETPAHPSPRLSTTYAPAATERTASMPSGGVHGNWSASGGMSIIAANGDSATIIAQRYNVPAETLLKVNGLSSAGQIHAGTRLVIPVYNSNGGVSRVATVETKTVVVRDHASREKLLAKRETVVVREKAQVVRDKTHWVKGPQPARLAEAEKIAPKSGKAEAVKIAKTEVVKTEIVRDKAGKVVKVETIREKPAKVAKVEPGKEAPVKVAKVEETAKKASVDTTPTASLPPAGEKIAANGNPEFRWPAHGRIIQGFKSGGNDGINIAVPEGTSVKAAEAGVVAYAGSEIKGFGNLVLIRHPNGYVTAYANNGALDVKRGEQVKRGQTIAKSGQSGNVASPQLHFELRKGSTPVDPTRFLAGL